MGLEEYAKEQLMQAYSRIASDKESSARIKNWCVTVWIGSLAVVNSNHPPFGNVQRLSLPLLPVFFFWLLDAIEHVYIALHVGHAKHLEAFILGLEQADAVDLRDLSLESGYKQGPFWKKLRNVTRHTFITKPVVVFYSMLCLVTLLFYLVLK